MGSTILTCWEEMRRPALDDFVVCRIEANENCDIKLLDIRIPDIYVDPSLIPIDEKTKLQNLSLLQKWPLIIACSMKATDTSSPFIYEYIHPQLLMLAIQKHSGNIRGVVYSSTKYDKKMGEGLNAYSNVAIPTKSSKSLGYCDYLSKCFKLTRGLPYIEAEIKNIFLQDVKDSEKSYCYRERTRFEQLESHLLSMELKSIQMSNELQS